ncbi:DUF6221 family protein [Streptomyces parvus]|uniref:DUF6221 family protein n=1 Tax=Streptomyces parvus TaxID=66428 RepID=UPI00332EF54A
MTDALVAFLKARFTDEESAAIAAHGPFSGDLGRRWWTPEEFKTALCHDQIHMSDAVYMAHHAPARTLREVEAKRGLLDEHRPDEAGGCTTCAQPEDFDDDADGNRTFSRIPKSWPCPTVKLLALPYSDHPGYEEALTGG